MTKKCICAALTEPECDCGAVDYGEREWVGLTDNEMLMIYGQQHEGKKYSLGRMVEQALKEKNNVS